jgi:hypothetical protein
MSLNNAYSANFFVEDIEDINYIAMDIQHSTAQHSTAQHSTAQHSTATYIMEQQDIPCTMKCEPCL